MTRQKWVRLGGLTAILAALAMLVGLLWPSSGAKAVVRASTATTTTAQVSTTTTTMSSVDEVKQLLGEMSVTKPCPDDRTANIGALQPVPPRIDGEAMAPPFSNNTDSQSINGQIPPMHCGDPLGAGTPLNFFANLTVDGVRLVDIDQWLAPFWGDAANINTTAMRYLEVATDPSGHKHLQVTKEWQTIAEYLTTLLGRFQLVGIQSHQSEVNYHLAGGGLQVGNFLPTVVKNDKQEALPAETYVLMEKGQCTPLLVVGFNTADRRFEEFAPTPCTQPPPASKVSPTPQAPVTTRPTPTTTVPRVTTPSVPPTTTPPTTCGRKCPVATIVTTPPTTVPPRGTTTTTPGPPTTVPSPTTTTTPVTQPRPPTSTTIQPPPTTV